MELNQLKYFLEVAETQHMTKSAEKLHIAQPSLTRAIHNLEDELKVPLFIPKGRNIILSEYGKYLQKKLTPIMEQLDKIPDMVRTKAKLTSNTIHLNVLAASTFISEAIVEYKKEHEQIHFQFLQNNQEDLYDILVSTGLPNQHNEHIDSATYIRDEKILLAVPNNERFTGRKSISLSEVIDENFISLSNSSQYRLICNKLCSDIGFKPHITFDSDSLLAVMNMIAENMGIGFWPEFTWGNLKSDRILLLEIEDGNFTRNIIISHKLNKTDNKNVIEFFEFLKNYCENQ